MEGQDGNYFLELNKYQRDNLLWLLLIAWQNPELGLGTGDWIGEIPHKLVAHDNYPELTEQDQPNCTLEEWRHQFDQRFAKR